MNMPREAWSRTVAIHTGSQIEYIAETYSQLSFLLQRWMACKCGKTPMGSTAARGKSCVFESRTISDLARKIAVNAYRSPCSSVQVDYQLEIEDVFSGIDFVVCSSKAPEQ